MIQLLCETARRCKTQQATTSCHIICTCYRVIFSLWWGTKVTLYALRKAEGNFEISNCQVLPGFWHLNIQAFPVGMSRDRITHVLSARKLPALKLSTNQNSQRKRNNRMCDTRQQDKTLSWSCGGVPHAFAVLEQGFCCFFAFHRNLQLWLSYTRMVWYKRNVWNWYRKFDCAICAKMAFGEFTTVLCW